RNGPADGSTDAGAGITATSGCASGVRSHAAMTLHAATATARRPMLKARASLAAPKSLDSNEPGTVAFAHGADPEPRGVAQSLPRAARTRPGRGRMPHARRGDRRFSRGRL